MASYSITVSGYPAGIHKTLTLTTADTVTVAGTAVPHRIEVLNTGSGAVYIRADGTTAVSAADATVRINAGTAVGWKAGPGTTVLSIVGSGDSYSVHALPELSWSRT